MKYKNVQPQKDVQYRFKFGQTYTYLIFDEYLSDGRLSFLNAQYGSFCPPMTQARFNYIMAKNKPQLTPLGQLTFSQAKANRPYRVNVASKQSNTSATPATSTPAHIPQPQKTPVTSTSRYTFSDLVDDIIKRLKRLTDGEKQQFNAVARGNVDYYVKSLNNEKMPFGTVAYLQDVFSELNIAL